MGLRTLTVVTLVLAGLMQAPAVIAPSRAADAPSVRLYAAGSLRSAMLEIAKGFTAAYGLTVDANFKSSGLLREGFEQGTAGDVFASADMGNPQKLEQEGLAGPVVLFARNQLCAIARPGLALTSATLLASILDPAVKLGTSTPKADPSGDYAWAMFAKADSVMPGSRAKLEAKALQLMGAPASPPPPDGLTPYAWHLKEGRADIFLAYCTGAKEALAQLPGATSVALPPELATGADYGLAVLKVADAGKANLLAMYILSAAGQGVLAKYGFEAPLQ
ncbi:MAG TPA: molybdate ABC transporter substrate-binding protein [Stellaceae bacterium]|jgi:ABC-type molybdate transport system substrate-binding protein